MAAPNTAENQGPISLLSVGTKILMRDAMDQYLRSLGDIRTYYASTMKNALRFIEEQNIHILLTEVFLEDGSAERLMKALGPRSINDSLWVIMALEEKREDLISLALELGANAVLIKPFAAVDLKNQLEKYKARQIAMSQVGDKGVELIKEADLALRERRTFDADKKYREASIASPSHFVVQQHCARFFLDKHEYGLAEKCVRAALAAKPNYVPALSLLGALELQRGNLEAAFEHLSAAHKLSPLHAERAMLIAQYYNRKSAETLEKILSSDENDAVARLHMGKSMIVDRDYVNGHMQLERCMEGLQGNPLALEASTYMALARKLGQIRKD